MCCYFNVMLGLRESCFEHMLFKIRQWPRLLLLLGSHLITQLFKFQSSALFQNSIYFPSPRETVTFCFGSISPQYFGNILKLETAMIVVLASCASLFSKITFLCWNLYFIYFPNFPFLYCSWISQIPNSPE